MYNPKHFEEHDIAVLHALIRTHPLSTWVTIAAGLATLLMFYREGLACKSCKSSGNPAPKDLTSDMYL